MELALKDDDSVVVQQAGAVRSTQVDFGDFSTTVVPVMTSTASFSFDVLKPERRDSDEDTAAGDSSPIMSLSLSSLVRFASQDLLPVLVGGTAPSVIVWI